MSLVWVAVAFFALMGFLYWVGTHHDQAMARAGLQQCRVGVSAPLWQKECPR